MGVDIIKSQNDNREYNMIKLDNLLDVLIIYDPDTKVSSASMSVGVGYYQDPPEFMGLAHFTEHMLFMGTKKYPNEDHFMNYINKNSGKTNAFTTGNLTNYFFDVKSSAFTEALDIFSQFFTNPLFKKNMVNREINAIDSEHAKNYNDDMWRINSVIKKAINQNHPFSKFGTGNLKTLTTSSSTTIRKALINFHKKHYSSNIMKLVILHNKPMTSQNLTSFSNIINKNVTYPQLPHLITTTSLIKILPNNSDDLLNIIWELPNLDKFFQCSPEKYLFYTIGHEAPGSIIHYLRKQNLATSLEIGTYDEDRSMALIYVSVTLTTKGFNNTSHVIHAIDHYRKMAKPINAIYNEIQRINKISFDYIEKDSPITTTSELSQKLFKIPPKYILTPNIIDYNTTNANVQQIITDCFNKMKNNKVIILSSRNYLNKGTDQVEEHYGVKYSITSPYQLTSDATTTIDFTNRFYPPKKNSLIPDSITILPQSPTQHTPKLLTTTQTTTPTWYAKDNTHNTPYVMISYIINCPRITKNITNNVITLLYNKIFKYMMTSYMYYANVAGSSFSLTTIDNTTFINIKTYPSNVNQMSKYILDKYFNLTTYINPHIFTIVKKEFMTNLQNYYNSSLYMLGKQYISDKCNEVFYTCPDMINTTTHITYDQIISLNNSDCKILIQGNISSDDAMTLSNNFKLSSPSQPTPNIISTNAQNLLQPGNDIYYYRQSFNENETNSLINIFYESGHIDKNKNLNDLAFLMIVNILMNEQFYNQLRTKEQSGYIVKSHIDQLGRNTQPIYGISYVIQTTNKPLNELKKSIKRFIKKSHTELNKSHYRTCINSLSTDLLHINDQLQTTHLQHLESILLNDYNFTHKQQLSNIIKQYDFNKFKKHHYDFFINKKTRKMRILEVHGNQHKNKNKKN